LSSGYSANRLQKTLIKTIESVGINRIGS